MSNGAYLKKRWVDTNDFPNNNYNGSKISFSQITQRVIRKTNSVGKLNTAKP